MIAVQREFVAIKQMNELSPVAGLNTCEAIFQPSSTVIERSQLTDFIRFCERETKLSFANHAAFHRFSVTEFHLFWHLFLRWSGIVYDGSAEPVCVGDLCESAKFFPNLKMNYTEILLGEDANLDQVAITACRFNDIPERLTRKELSVKVARLASFLDHLGVRPGDRVAVIARNGAEAIVAALAAASIGAVFCSCAPEMGTFAILSRFTQIAPVVLMGHARPASWDIGPSVADRLTEVAGKLPSLKNIIVLDDAPLRRDLTIPVWRLIDVVNNHTFDLKSERPRFSFNHPLCILFSSGTTGTPKCILHGAGGTLLEHIKEHRLHCDLRSGDKLFFQTSCAWMMWNWQLTALASGTELVLYDGPLNTPEALWRLVEEQAVTVFGTNPAYLQLCERMQFSPRRTFSLAALRGILSTGSTLYPRQFDWVRSNVKELPLQSISGGSDIIGCFVLGNPNLPVYRGEAQCRSLGLDVRSLPAAAEPNASIGELICANPFPSRPLGLYGDESGEHFHEAYFSQNAGVWTHGDLIEFTPGGGALLHGRSDGVLNVRGIRVGPSEIYTILQDIDEVADAMAVEQSREDEPGGSCMVLLVVLRAGVLLDDPLTLRIRSKLMLDGSIALVPDRIAQVDALPLTHSGKRSEAAACDALNGREVRNLDSLQNPECLEAIANLAALLRSETQQTHAQHVRSFDSREELEKHLQEICSDALGLKSVGVSVNLFDTGANSLTALSILLEIEKLLEVALPYSSLFHTRTIEKLAALIFDSTHDEAEHATLRPLSIATGLQVRAAGSEDVDSICLLLHEGFGTDPVAPEQWRSLFNYKWLEEKPNLGFVLTDGDAIVGFLGTIYATRRIDDKSLLVCNLTSWYVRPEYKGWGLLLMEAAVRDARIGYTALSPAPVTREILKLMGFQAIDAGTVLFAPFLHINTLRRPAPTITFDLERIAGLLNDAERQILHDHLPYDCLHAVISDGGETCYVIAKRRRRRLHRFAPIALPYSELLHCSSPEVLARHLERVKLTIMWRHRAVALVADEHLLPALYSRGIELKNESLYRAADFNPRELDKLYSELVMLPI